MGQVQTNGRPIETTPVPPGTPRWGAQWKKAVKENYQSALKPGTGVHGSMYSYRDVYVDLDPTYKDRFGRPLARITMDFHDNEIKQNAFLTDKFAEIFQAMGAKQVDKEYRKAPYDVTKYQTTHLCGGAIMGTDPSTSAINRYLQSWDVPNLFVTGASAFPAECRLQPDRHRGGAGLLGGRCDPQQISQEPGTADQCVARSVIAVAVAVAAARGRGRVAPATCRILPRSSAAAIWRPPPIAAAVIPCRAAASRSRVDGRSRRRSAFSSRPTSRPTAKPGSAPGATINSMLRSGAASAEMARGSIRRCPFPITPGCRART